MIDANFCKFKEVNQFTYLSKTQSSAGILKSSRILKEHIYGSNLSWRQRETNSITKSYFFLLEKRHQKEEIQLQIKQKFKTPKRGMLRNKRNSESFSITFSSKMDTNKSNQ